jgi:hypothetical protein
MSWFVFLGFATGVNKFIKNTTFACLSVEERGVVENEFYNLSPKHIVVPVICFGETLSIHYLYIFHRRFSIF